MGKEQYEAADGYSLPQLPVGYEAQPFWGFHDAAGGLAYQFTRVYGPPVPLGARGPVRTLDPDRSYWEVTWRTRGEDGEDRPTVRWLSYAHARKRVRRLSFERFSSMQMRDELPGLLRVGEVVQPPVADNTKPRAMSKPLVPARRPV